MAKKKKGLIKELALRFTLSVIGGFMGFNFGCYLGSLLGMNSRNVLMIIGSVFCVIFAYAFGFKIMEVITE